MKNLILALVLLLPLTSKADVWETTSQWSPAWEERYQDWVVSNWTLDIFRSSRTSYPGLYPDCADSVYSMRVIFASQHGLPFAMLNPNSRSSVISNQIKRFDGVPEGTRRVTAYLNWLFDVIGTQTLENDSYPPAINRDSVTSGGFMLAKKSKHSYSIKKIRETGVPILYYSTQGNRSNLKERSWPSVEYLFADGIKAPSGIRNFRQPQDILKNVWDVPGYSDEQYRVSMGRWTSTMQQKLARRQETFEEALKRGMADACQLLETRIEMVNQAARKNAQLGSSCMNARDYDDLSTPSRDGQTKAALNDLKDVYDRAKSKNADISRKLKEQLDNIFADSLREETGNQYCEIAIGRNKTLTMGEFRRRQNRGWISSNPNDPSQIRWGEIKGPSEKAARCPIY